MSQIITARFAQGFNDLTEQQLSTLSTNLSDFSPQVGILGEYMGVTLKATEEQASAAASALLSVTNHLDIVVEEVLTETREEFEARVLAEAEVD